MFGKRNIFYSIFRMKCPRCHNGNLYKSSILEGIYNMHENCPSCHQRYELEPGFFWGAMYIGYALSSGYMLTGTVLGILLFGLTPMGAVFATALGGILIFPITARLARSIWIHIYVRYNEKIAKSVSKSKKEGEPAA